MQLAVPLPEEKTARGRKLVWRYGDGFSATDPLSAWQALLASRGLQESDPFFAPRLADLPDPDAMQDMAKAADRLVHAIVHGEKLHVFGDFDADGVNGTAILREALAAAGAQVSSSIPHRADDGHGIGVEPLREAHAQGVGLGISVDTGTTCFEACDEALRLGLDLIVTDHHLPEASLPSAFALLNPAREDCGFADRKLCGTGVAFFLLMAVWKRLKQQGVQLEYDLRSLLDRVAIATVADVMPLVGVNRILVYHGLMRLNQEPSTGIRALLDVSRLAGKPITTESIGFYLAPRINAAGRMRHGDEAMRLLCTFDEQEAAQLALILDQANKQRRQVEAEVFKQAEEKLGEADVLAVYDEAWHAGVVGLAAGRLARKHGLPAAVGFIEGNGSIRVSMRGRPGFHIGELLHACAEHLHGFGGHAGAGGGTVRDGAWAAFRTSLAEAIAEQAKTAGERHVLEVDARLTLGALHAGLAERLQRFEPTGQGNRPCLWLVPDVTIADRKDLKGGVVRLQLTDGVQWANAVVFGAGPLDEYLQRGQILSLIGQLQLDEWRGNGAVQFVVEDVLVAG